MIQFKPYQVPEQSQASHQAANNTCPALQDHRQGHLGTGNIEVLLISSPMLTEALQEREGHATVSVASQRRNIAGFDWNPDKLISRYS